MRLAYSPYGLSDSPPENYCLAFNGELWQAAFQGYLLGNGRRPFNPILMRFMTADRMSPFGRGGLNTYAYCAGDPINNVDPSGHFFLPSRLAHAINSKAGRTVFNARKRMPFKVFGVDTSLDPYKLKRALKRGEVEGVVAVIPTGSIGAVMDKYPTQARQVFTESTRLAFEEVVSQAARRAIDGAGFVAEPRLHGLAIHDATAVALVASGLSDKLGSHGVPLLLQAAWFKDNNGLGIQKILSRRLNALRAGQHIPIDDWYASLNPYL